MLNLKLTNLIRLFLAGETVIFCHQDYTKRRHILPHAFVSIVTADEGIFISTWYRSVLQRIYILVVDNKIVLIK